MRNLPRAFKAFAPWQKIAVAIMVLLILLTWLAVCLVMTGYLSL